MNRNLKIFSLFMIVLVVGAIFLTGCAKKETLTNEQPTPNPEDQTGPRKFIIVVEEWPPYDIDDGKGGSGIEIDTVRKALDTLGVQYEIKFQPWDRDIDDVKTGAADGILSASYSKEREEFLYYTDAQRALSQTTDYVFLVEYNFFIKASDASKIKFESYDQLKTAGYKIGINSGYTYSDEFNNANLTTENAPAEPINAFNALIGGRYDLYLNSKAVGLLLLKDNNLTSQVVVLPKPVLTESDGLLFSKKSNYPDAENLMKKFYAEVAKMRASGEYQKIYDKYTK